MGGTFTQKITRISSFDDALFAETSTRMGAMEYRLSNDARNTTPWFSVVRNKCYLLCSRITGVRDGWTFLPRGAPNNPVLPS
jgi:hypothetical protein